MMKQTIFNELSNARNTNNMNMLAVMFQVFGQLRLLPSNFIDFEKQ